MNLPNKTKVATLIIVTVFAGLNAFTRADDNSKQNTKKELNNLSNGNKTPGQVFDGQKYTAPVRPQTSTNTVTAAQISKQQNSIPANQPPKRQGPSIDHINVPAVAPKQNQANPVTSKATQPKKATP
jgi:hypothetical protein